MLGKNNHNRNSHEPEEHQQYNRSSINSEYHDLSAANQTINKDASYYTEHENRRNHPNARQLTNYEQQEQVSRKNNRVLINGEVVHNNPEKNMSHGLQGNPRQHSPILQPYKQQHASNSKGHGGIQVASEHKSSILFNHNHPQK